MNVVHTVITERVGSLEKACETFDEEKSKINLQLSNHSVIITVTPLILFGAYRERAILWMKRLMR